MQPAPYPDLMPIMADLKSRMDASDNDAHRHLLDKWLAQLARIHKEMRKLEKLEQFSSAVHDPK